MNKRIPIILGIVAAVALAAAPFAFAQHRGHDGRQGAFGRTMMLGHLAQAKEELGLTDSQVTEIKGIFQSLHEQNAQYRAQLHSGMAGVAQALISNPNDLAAAQALLDQQNAAEQTMKSNALAAAAKALNVLTPDQRAKLGAKLAERAARNRD